MVYDVLWGSIVDEVDNRQRESQFRRNDDDEDDNVDDESESMMTLLIGDHDSDNDKGHNDIDVHGFDW